MNTVWILIYKDTLKNKVFGSRKILLDTLNESKQFSDKINETFSKRGYGLSEYEDENYIIRINAVCRKKQISSV